MKKLLVTLIAAIMTAVSFFPVSATGEKAVANQNVMEKADYIIRCWDMANDLALGLILDKESYLFQKSKPENFNFDGKLTQDNIKTVFLYSWINNFEQQTDYIVDGESESYGAVFDVPENVMLSVIQKNIVCGDVKASDLPFYNKNTHSFKFAGIDWGGEALDDEYWGNWKVSKNERGNWVCQYNNSHQESYPLLKKFTLELTAQYKVVSVFLDIKIKSLEWVSQPKVTEYEKGEPLDINGAKIRARHSDGASWEIPVTKDMVSGYDSSKTGKQTVKVQYYNQSVSYSVTVKSDSSNSSSNNGNSSTESNTSTVSNNSGSGQSNPSNQQSGTSSAQNNNSSSGHNTDSSGQNTNSSGHSGTSSEENNSSLGQSDISGTASADNDSSGQSGSNVSAGGNNSATTDTDNNIGLIIAVTVIIIVAVCGIVAGAFLYIKKKK